MTDRLPDQVGTPGQIRVSGELEKQAAQGEIHAAVRKVLEGFERGVFVRSTANDANPGWAIELFPYLRALAIVQEAYGESQL